MREELAVVVQDMVRAGEHPRTVRKMFALTRFELAIIQGEVRK
jgi:hypothetical protein